MQRRKQIAAKLSRRAAPHDIVQANACEDEGLTRARSLLQRGEQIVEAVDQYAKCILRHSPGLRQSIIEDSLLVVHVPPRGRFH